MRAKINWDFAELCDKATNADVIVAAFTREIRALGFSYAACASHVDPLRPPPGAVMIVDYPIQWLEHYSTQNYAAHDPVFKAARQQALPFYWRDRRFRGGLDGLQRAMFAEAAEVGLSDGLTIPIHAPHALPASCSLAIGPDGVDPLSLRQAHWYAVYTHETVRALSGVRGRANRPVLSPRERQCIALIAQGKDDYAVGVLLGINERTAHNTVCRAMRKYGVATRVQAFVRALRDGEIRLEDVAT